MPTKRAAAAPSIDDYIAAHPPKVRAILTRIRRTVKKAVPGAAETISYQMPTFTLNGVVVHFAAFTNHIGLYPPVRGDAALLKDAAPYANEKGNLRFPLDAPVPYDLITRIVQARAALNLAKPRRRQRRGTGSDDASCQGRRDCLIAAQPSSRRLISFSNPRSVGSK